ncbi:PepSY domain-containing protein [Streptomyces sp. NPDC004838]
MKRKTVIAVTAAALLAGGAYTAVASPGADPVPAAGITVDQAVKAALGKTPGSVESAEREDDGKGEWEIEIRAADGAEHDVRVDALSGQVLGSQPDDDSDDSDDSDDRGDRDDTDKAERKGDGDNGDRDGDDGSARPQPQVNAQQAADAALAFRSGTVTEIDFEDAHWEVEVRAEDGGFHEVTVDSRTGKASAAPKDDD